MDVKNNLENNPGCKQLILQKLSCAVVCSVLSQGLFLILYLFVQNINFWRPFDWLFLTFSTFASFSTWIYLIPLASIIFAQSVICAKDYVYKATHCGTRFKRFCLVFTLRNVFIGVLHVLVGGLLVWLHLSLSGGEYENLNKVCQDSKNCLNEGTLFIILNGFWIGVYYFIQVYVYGEKYMIFPVIHLKKLPMLKFKIGVLLRSNFKQALWPLYLYFILYYLWGSAIKTWIGYNFNLHIEEVSTFDIYLNFSVLFYAYLFSVLYMFNMGCMRLFFELFLTEQVKFAIENVSNNLCLSNALTMDSLPVVQHLAALDLFLLSTRDYNRRQELFKLSQPGGHPHNWNSIITPLLNLLNNYTAVLNASTEVLLSNDQVVHNQKVQSTPVANIKSPIIQSPNKYTNIRNMSMPRAEPIEIVSVTQSNILSVQNSLVLKCTSKFNQIVNVVKTKIGWKYLFEELPEANIRLCLSNGQVICWTAQGLSFISSASLAEDMYGVVQKDLCSIVTTLVLLKKSVDKLFKLNKKGSYNDFQLKMRFALRSAIRRSLFNISKTFGNHLHDLPLSADIRSHIETYINCKEG